MHIGRADASRTGCWKIRSAQVSGTLPAVPLVSHHNFVRAGWLHMRVPDSSAARRHDVRTKREYSPLARLPAMVEAAVTKFSRSAATGNARATCGRGRSRAPISPGSVSRLGRAFVQDCPRQRATARCPVDHVAQHDASPSHWHPLACFR